MRRALAVAAMCAVAPAAAAAADVGVAIPGRTFAPARLQVLSGDTVTWRNGDFGPHNLVAGDGSFASGLLSSGAAYAHRFDAPGVHPYVCTLHAGMAGEIDVVDVALQGPASAPAAGERFTLTGRAIAGTGPVALERAPGAAGPFEPVATVTPGPDGAFSATLTADAPATWRASAGGLSSPPVAVAVAPRVRLRLRARRRGALVFVAVATMPARPEQTVVLERYLRERFAWRRAEVARLDAHGRTTFSLPARRRQRVRVRYRAPGRSAPVLSRPLSIRPGAPAGRRAPRAPRTSGAA